MAKKIDDIVFCFTILGRPACDPERLTVADAGCACGHS
jgi:hypothetical protein